MSARDDAFPVAGKPLAWSARDRQAELDRARSGGFDLVILGGGITGAGLAREAALHGLTFLLLEQGDFASGTSSHSSKLIHGGLRYLPQGRLHLVRESATERNWLHAALPHLVRPLGFHYCAFAEGPDTPFQVRAGLWAYQLLSSLAGFRSPGSPRFFSPAAFATEEPTFRRDGLRLAGRYFDAATDDARLVIETLKEARDLSGGRSVALNHARAALLPPGPDGRRGVAVEDLLGGEPFEVRARCIVNATGVWADRILNRPGLLRPTKGVHLAVPAARLGNGAAFALRSVDDGRFVFVLRRGEISLIGTTDTDYQGPLETPRCERADADYLLRTVNAYFPEARLSDADILATTAGLRPLVPEEGEAEARPSEVSREHLILDDGAGLVTVTGGKLTTFRAMAWEVLRRCADAGYLRPLRGPERRKGFSRRPYKTGVTWEAFAASLASLGLKNHLPEPTLRHLHQKYGHGAVAILREVRRAPELGRPLVEGHPFCEAELNYLLTFEQAPRLEDVLLRRTELHLVVSHRRQAELAARVGAIMARAYRWDEARLEAETGRYLDHVQRAVAFLEE